MVALFLLGLLAAEPASTWSSVTFALQRPLPTGDEETLLYRLPHWEATFRFDRYAIPIAPPTAGGELAAQLAQLARLSGPLGAARLVAVTPPVGTVGWETSNNLGYLPLGGRPTPVATERDDWLAALAGADVGTIALLLEGLTRQPTVEELGDYLDAWLAATAARGKNAELWVPAELSTEDSPVLAALTPERLAKLRLVWLSIPETVELQAAAAKRAAEAEAKQASEAPVVPTPVQRAERTAALLESLAGDPPLDRGIDLYDGRSNPLQGLAPLQDYLTAGQAAGYGHLVIRARLDTPQNEVWAALLQGLSGRG